MLGKYYVTGWSARFGTWMAEVYDARTMEAARERFAISHPQLRQIKAYALRSN
jgi:hypothetical protein